MGKVITGSHAKINDYIKGIPDDELIGLVSSADGKISVLVKTNGIIGEPIGEGVEKYEDHIAELTKALADCKIRAEKEITKLQKENAAHLNQVGVFSTENALLNKEISDLKKELEKCKNQSAKEIEKLKKAIDSLGA